MNAFDQLRAEGFDARGPSEDCGTCSHYAVPVGSPYVYWNEQTHERSFEVEPDESPMTYGGNIFEPLGIAAGHKTAGYMKEPAPNQAELDQIAQQRALEVLLEHGLEAKLDEHGFIDVAPTKDFGRPKPEDARQLSEAEAIQQSAIARWRNGAY